MSYLSYHRSMDHLDFTADRLMEVLEETESEAALEMDPRRMEESRRLLDLSELEIERFNDLDHHEVKDYHVWSVKKPEHKDQIADALMSDRDVLKEATNELESTLDRMKGLREHVFKVHTAYAEHVERMQEVMQGPEAQQFNADFSVDAIERDVLPMLDRLLYKLDQVIESFEKELQGRLQQLHHLGRQIAWLRGGPSPIKAAQMGEDEPPEQDETPEEQPTQAEAIVEHDMEQVDEFDVNDMDRGRKDERSRKRGGRGGRGGKN